MPICFSLGCQPSTTFTDKIWAFCIIFVYLQEVKSVPLGEKLEPFYFMYFCLGEKDYSRGQISCYILNFLE